MLDSAKEIAKAEKAYAIKIDPDVEVDKGTDALQNFESAWFLNIKDLKKVYQKTTSNHV